jgi:sulfite reductase (NADPH) flavoprotein alpha-component
MAHFMLNKEKLKVIQELVENSTKEELIWLNGYFEGLVAQIENQVKIGTAKSTVDKITIAYGTETGNSKRLATDFASKAKKVGIRAKIVSLDQYRLDDLHKEDYLFTVISTQGDGEPPAAAKKFYDHIHRNGFKLQQLKYGVLALGDTAYPLFCKAGEDVDEQLQKLGAQRIATLQKCDIDFENDAGRWFSDILQKLNSRIAQKEDDFAGIKKSTGKKNYKGKVISNINLNDKGSKKQTHHIEIAADGLSYEPGDSIGLIPINPKHTVESIISLFGVDQSMPCKNYLGELSVFDLLHKKLNIINLPDRVVKKYSTLVKQAIPETKISLLDLIKIYPVKESLELESILNILEPITPRLYSISSSLQAHDGEVHITVSRDKYLINNELKYGLCSDFLSHLKPGEFFDFYIHKNSQFKLPAGDKDIIMVGPGTGIAPFRSFLEERDLNGDTGRNWLFFGDQCFATDFLYQTEIQNWLATGLLTQVNVAFSRDQSQKIYVQDKMVEHEKELFAWLDSGAYLFICGAKEPMSVDVENTLLRIIRSAGNKTENEAYAYLDELKESGKYVKDVY